MIELQNMAIYWDTDVTLVGDLPSRDLEVRFVAHGPHLMQALAYLLGLNTVNLNILMQIWANYYSLLYMTCICSRCNALKLIG